MVDRLIRRLAVIARRPGVEVGLAAGVAVVAMLVVGRFARDSWFLFDHWDFLTKREIGSIDSLLDPHAGHWQVYTVVLHRVLYGMVGVDFFPAYLIPRLVFPAGVAFAAWLAMRWRGADRSMTWVAYLVLLFSGVGAWHTSATIGNGLVHMSLIGAAVLVAAVDDPTPRDVMLLGTVLLVALSASGLGIAAFGAVAVVVALRRMSALAAALVPGERRWPGPVRLARYALRHPVTLLRAWPERPGGPGWWPALLAAGGLYALWYGTYGGEASNNLSLSVETLRDAPKAAYDVVAAALRRTLWAGDWPALLLVAGLAGAIAWAAHRRRLGPFESVLLAAAAVYVPMVVLRRVVTGQSSAEAVRYAYVLTVLLLPALVPAIRFPTRSARWAAAALALVVLYGNVTTLRAGIDEWEKLGRRQRETVSAAAMLLAAGEPSLPTASPAPPEDGQLTVAGLQGLVDDGWVPEGPVSDDALSTARLNIRVLAQKGFRVVERGPFTEVAVDAESCLSLDTGEALPVEVVRKGPISVTGIAGTTLSLEWADRYGVGRRSLVIGGADWILWLAEPEGDTTLTITPTAATVRVCGLRNR